MLTAAAKRFAEGQLDDPVVVDRGDRLGLLVWNLRQHRGRQAVLVDRDDELGQLTRSFELMRQRLRQSRAEIERWNQELERRVAERTEEVARRNQERAQLLAQIMAAHEDERRRLAGELHDEVSQTLASVLIALESLPATEPLTAGAQARVADLCTMIAATIDNVHGLAAELRPSILDDVGLVAALDRLVGEFRDRHGLSVDFQAVGFDGIRLLAPVETALFRIAQAALNNVAYHAAARAASVLLQRRGDRLRLVVEDDGRGFDVAAVRAAPLKDRLGLAGIEERVQLVGGRLTIESEPGHGTSLYVELAVAPNLRAELAHA
jgi:signal transduction histidine kinase